MGNNQSPSLSWNVLWRNAAVALPLLFVCLVFPMVIIYSVAFTSMKMDRILSGLLDMRLVYLMFLFIYVPLSAKLFLMDAKRLFLKLLVAALVLYFIERVISLHLIATLEPYFNQLSSVFALVAASPVLFIFTLVHYYLLKKWGERLFGIKRVAE